MVRARIQSATFLENTSDGFKIVVSLIIPPKIYGEFLTDNLPRNIDIYFSEDNKTSFDTRTILW